MVTWNVSPEIASIGSLHLRWYGMLFASGFVLGYRIVRNMFLVERRSLGGLDALFIYTLLGTVIGARLGHTLFYEPDVYLNDPLRILKIWEGGLASHGAALGILCSVFLYSKRRKTKEEGQSYLWILDRLTIPIALAGAFIRLGNLMNSEIVGKPTSVPWAFIFVRVDYVARHPAQLYESICYFIIFVVMFLHYRKHVRKEQDGFLTGMFLVSVFGARFLLEFLKEVQVTAEAALPFDFGQMFSLPLILLGIGLIWRASRLKKQQMRRSYTR